MSPLTVVLIKVAGAFLGVLACVWSCAVPSHLPSHLPLSALVLGVVTFTLQTGSALGSEKMHRESHGS